ncbi:conserved hypothetical protein [Ahrensia sp. R2A130]|nr:conserved hypothetical protein [Ahrensia sp. R2A130]
MDQKVFDWVNQTFPTLGSFASTNFISRLCDKNTRVYP